ncbi:MAG: Ribonuclease VapC3 [Candidatus Bathyarchaeota archaeon BA1]|nr:MAG: Ribonuclease VapC3 [Candidatus Bathyarchaeota archaeon BA1]
MVYVIDASVASRFLLVEDLSDKARLVLENFLGEVVDLRAPKLVVYEVGNTLWKAVKRGFINLGEAEEKFSYFLGLRIDSIELDEEEHKDVLDWGVKNDATYYDSTYVKASKKIGATLLTADDILYEKAYKEILTVHLKDY